MRGCSYFPEERRLRDLVAALCAFLYSWGGGAGQRQHQEGRHAALLLTARTVKRGGGDCLWSWDGPLPSWEQWPSKWESGSEGPLEGPLQGGTKRGKRQAGGAYLTGRAVVFVLTRSIAGRIGAVILESVDVHALALMMGESAEVCVRGSEKRRKQEGINSSALIRRQWEASSHRRLEHVATCAESTRYRTVAFEPERVYITRRMPFHLRTLLLHPWTGPCAGGPLDASPAVPLFSAFCQFSRSVGVPLES